MQCSVAVQFVTKVVDTFESLPSKKLVNLIWEDVGGGQAVLPDQDEALRLGGPELGRAGHEEARVAQEEASLPE